jgi:hypothetical protein
LAAVVAASLLTLLLPFVAGQRVGAAATVTRGDRAVPTGEQLIHRMLQGASMYGTYHKVMVSLTVNGSVRETLRQAIDVDLGRHLLHQLGDDRVVRSPHTLLSDETFERISVGYRAATRNAGGAWSCQLFQPGNVQIVGQQSYLAGLGWPRRAVNLGPAVWNGVRVWRAEATVSGGASAGGYAPAQRADLLVARSSGTLLREAWRTGNGSVSVTYSGYGKPVRVALPTQCRPHANLTAVRRAVSARPHPASGGRVQGTVSPPVLEGGTRIALESVVKVCHYPSTRALIAGSRKYVNLLMCSGLTGSTIEN